MKRENFFHKIIQTSLVFGITLLVVVCGVGGIRQKPSTKERVNITEESEKEGKSISNDDLGTESAGEEETVQPINISDAETESAVLIQDEQEIELQGNVLNYGGLIVELPEGIEARVIDTKDNGNIFCTENFLSKENKGRIMDLCGAQEVYADRVWGDEIAVYLDLPSRVRLLHYTAVYDSETALLCVFFDLLPEAVGSRMYANQAKKEYAYCLQQDGYLYLFLVKGEEVCLVQEIAEEEKYSFGALLTDGAVRWKESGDSVRFWTKPDTFSYRKIVPEEGISLFYVCDRQGDVAELRLYREGNYETPCQVIHGYMKGEDYIHIEDVNFDGCIDLIGSSDTGNSKVYLWNRQTKAYEQAQAEIPLYYLYHRRFPETESVWGVTTYAASLNWGPTSEAEAIWQWEGSTLVKKRECVVSIVEDGLRVWAYAGTPDRLILDETFSLEEWEQEQQDRVRLLYGQFYDGMVPEEVYAIEHRMEGERKIIPQELLDEICSVMAAGKDPAILSEVWGGEASAVLSGEAGKYSSYLSSAAIGRELTKDEILALAERDMAIRQKVQDAAKFNYRYTLVEADCDNDGTDDLVGELYGHFIGGTSGNADYVFWKGQPDGTYVKTDDFSEMEENFGVIAYEGKNYLCRATFDYGRMINNGYALDCYEDGKRVEETVIYVVPERYEIRQISAEVGYADSAVRMTEECTTIKEQLDEGWMIEGEAEQTTEQTRGQKSAYELTYYHCDLDNDGQEETYSKWYRQLANYDGLNYLDFSMVGSDNEKENRGIAMLLEKMESIADTPVALWVEAYEGKNIVNVLYMTGLADYRITGYLVGETDCKEVYEIAADATYKVEQERLVVF
ncbi:MAG: hypothetical protein K2O65_08555 [Lachnospiraceae bacterium]|nr:hypothetical protein [Lachnospiraceae bacterium]